MIKTNSFLLLLLFPLFSFLAKKIKVKTTRKRLTPSPVENVHLNPNLDSELQGLIKRRFFTVLAYPFGLESRSGKIVLLRRLPLPSRSQRPLFLAGSFPSFLSGAKKGENRESERGPKLGEKLGNKAKRVFAPFFREAFRQYPIFPQRRPFFLSFLAGLAFSFLSGKLFSAFFTARATRRSRKVSERRTEGEKGNLARFATAALSRNGTRNVEQKRNNGENEIKEEKTEKQRKRKA